MARGTNKVILIGNLGNGLETIFMPRGGAVTNVTVATSEIWTGKQSGNTANKRMPCDKQMKLPLHKRLALLYLPINPALRKQKTSARSSDLLRAAELAERNYKRLFLWAYKRLVQTKKYPTLSPRRTRQSFPQPTPQRQKRQQSIWRTI